MTMMRVSLTSLLLILGIFSSSTWAFLEVQRRTACSEGQVQCGDGSRCIPYQWVCDGDNDCGDNSDEEPEECASVTCGPGYFTCPTGSRRRCIHEGWLCNGYNDCSDNSDEDPQTCQSNGAAQVRMCMNALQPCAMLGQMAYVGMTDEEILEQIRTTDLSETCGPVLQTQECAVAAMSSQACQLSDADHPSVIQLRKSLLAMNTTVNFVCRENVEAFSEHGGCLLRPGAGGRRLAIFDTFRQQCRIRVSGTCPPPQLLTCAQSVIREQCGEPITSLLTTLGSRVLRDMGCTGRKRSKMTKKDIDFDSFIPLESWKEMMQSLF